MVEPINVVKQLRDGQAALLRLWPPVVPTGVNARNGRARMRTQLSRLLVLAALLVFPAAAARGGDHLPEKGAVSRSAVIWSLRTDRKLKVKIPLRARPPGAIIDRAEIEDMIVAVDPRRLGHAPPENRTISGLREELAEKREDPDARITAIRLYLHRRLPEPAGVGAQFAAGP